MAHIKLQLVTEERWPVIRLRNPSWDLMCSDLQRIPEISPIIRKDEEIEKGAYDTDYYDQSGESRNALPNWFNLWYHHMGPMMDVVLPELKVLYKFEPDLKVDNPSNWNIWCQSYAENGTHGAHTHGFGQISACQYIKFIPGEHEATTFYHLPPNPFTGDAESITPDVEEGDVIFFPSTYMHASGVNTSQHQRHIVAWNMGVRR